MSWRKLNWSKISTGSINSNTQLRHQGLFTEKGLYMLATILKSPKAVETTLAIIDTFANVRELSRVIHQVQTLPENSPKHKTLMEQTGNLIADLIIPDDELEITGTETTYEMNLAIFKIKRTAPCDTNRKMPPNYVTTAVNMAFLLKKRIGIMEYPNRLILMQVLILQRQALHLPPNKGQVVSVAL